MGDLYPHVTQSTQADDTDLLPRTGTPVAQGRERRDTGTEQGRNARQILLRMPDAQEKLVKDFVAAWTKVMNLDRYDL